MFNGITRDLIGVYLGDSPKFHKKVFEEILQRAVKLIDIEPEEASILNEKRYVVEGMILSLFPEYFTYDDQDTYETPDLERMSFAKKIFLNINNLELDSEDSFSWSQYFGLLALMEIDNYILQNELIYEEMDPPSHIPNWEELLINGRIYTLLNSCEAVCYGETLLEANSPTERIVKDKISKQAQQAVLKRHQPLRDLKNSFIKFYLESKDKSNKSSIARKFYRSLSDEDQKIICQTQEVQKAVRTLIGHLNKVMNNQHSAYIFT